MSNKRISGRNVSKNTRQNIVETPMGTPVQQMWEVLRVHEDRIKQLSGVIEKVIDRLDKINVIDNNIKVSAEIAAMHENISQLQKQLNKVEKENKKLKASIENEKISEHEAL